MEGHAHDPDETKTELGARAMNDKEKLERINEIARLTWDWLCKNPIMELVTPIGRIIGLSSFEDCFGTENCNAVEYGECMRADACSERASENQSMEETTK